MILAPFHSFRNCSWICSILSASAFFALTGCGDSAGGASNAKGSRGAGGPAPVIVGKAERKVVPLVVTAIGSVEPIRSASVRGQITGTLFKIDIREGQDVAQGDLLFEIDPRPYENALKSAQADQRRIAVQLDTARTQLARYKNLNVGAMISQQDFQQYEDAVRTLESQAVSADASLATARLNLSYCSIRAPIGGRTGVLNVHEGDMIRTSDATTLVTINQLSPIYVTFGVAQQHLAALNRYQAEGTLKVNVTPGPADPRMEDGALSFVDNTVDSTTGTIKLKATFQNSERRLWPGQFAEVIVTLASPEVIAVAASAIQNDQAGQHVFVVKNDGTAEFRNVVVERSSDESAVIAQGLTAGETVVTDGQLRVVNGGKVQIKSPETLTNPEAAQASESGAHSGQKAKKQGT